MVEVERTFAQYLARRHPHLVDNITLRHGELRAAAHARSCPQKANVRLQARARIKMLDNRFQIVHILSTVD